VKVSDLQKLLADLEPLLTTCGTKAAAITDLKKVREGLAPFSQLSLKDFAGFLARAEAYSRGEVPVKPSRGSGSRPKPGVSPKVDATVLAQQVRALYDRAGHPSTTDEQIDSQTAELGQLSKDGLVIVAEAIGLLGMKNAKKKADIVAKIRQRILARKGTTQRAGMIDRPGSQPHTGAVPSEMEVEETFSTS
jgi:hypothetical protein